MEQLMNIKTRNIALVLVAILLISGLYALLPVTRVSVIPNLFQHSDPARDQSISPAIATTNISSLPDFTAIVEKASPAVVSIRVSGLKQTGNQAVPPWMDKNNPLYDFFQHFGLPGPGNEMPNQPIEGQGSGFIIQPDGHILTNAHVVENADKITVKLSDNHEYDAKLVGIDRPSDVAIIKIDADNLFALTPGDSDQLKVGEWVVAIGSPFGFEHTVSAGIVSAKLRTLPDGNTVPFIQTDVAINPGNSGGPLLNLKGEVVGINAQIYSQNGGYMGLSFAIPINYAMNVEQQLVQYGKVTRGRLGVMIQNVNQDLAEAFGMDKPRGALVSQVQEDSPAEKAGVKSGDVILSVDETEVDDSAQVARLIAAHKPGSTARLEILREGKTMNLAVAIDELSDTSIAGNTEGNTPELGRLGVVVQDLDPDAKNQLHADHGVLVQQVSGAAARAGVQSGDVILAINSDKVTNSKQLKKMVEKAPKHIALLIKRGENEIFIPVQLG
jgi:serine protease Do